LGHGGLPCFCMVRENHVTAAPRARAGAKGSKKRAAENASRKPLIKKDLTGYTSAQDRPGSPAARQPDSFGGAGTNGALGGAVHLGGQLPHQRGQNLRLRKADLVFSLRAGRRRVAGSIHFGVSALCFAQHANAKVGDAPEWGLARALGEHVNQRIGWLGRGLSFVFVWVRSVPHGNDMEVATGHRPARSGEKISPTPT